MKVHKPKGNMAIPRFASEDDERRFWGSHEAAEYFDFGRAVHASFPSLKTTTVPISIRLPLWMIEELKSLANAQDVSYQSLMKIFRFDRLAQERSKKSA